MRVLLRVVPLLPLALVNRIVRRLHWLRGHDEIHEDLRGWAWDRSPVKPRAYLGLSISEVAYKYCDTYRSLWLRKRAHAQPHVAPNSPLSRGRDIHTVLSLALSDSQEALRRGWAPTVAYERLAGRAWQRLSEHGIRDKQLVGFYKAMVHLTTASGLLQAMLGESHATALVIERQVDGSPLGLSSQLRVDALAPSNIVIEFKYGSNSNPNHKVGLAGYAMALESELESPVDFGIIFYIRNPSAKPQVSYEPVYLGNYLRRIFLEYRDEAIDVLLSPEPPQLATNCTTYCPFYHYCYQGHAQGVHAGSQASVEGG